MKEMILEIVGTARGRDKLGDKQNGIMLAMFSASKPAGLDREVLISTPLSPSGEFKEMFNTKSSSILVAGMDITSWPIVEIVVPAGPLGILLDGSCTDAALLDDFAPVTREGTPGAVEASKQVRNGSVLVGMDKLNFIETPRKTLAEIGILLREAAHLKRQLRFRVPPLNYQKPESTTPVNDKLKLLTGPKSSSSLEEGNEAGKVTGEWSSWMWNGLRAATTLAPPVSPATNPEVQATPAQPAKEPMALIPSAANSPGKTASFVRVTGLEDRGLEDYKPFVPASSDRVVSMEVPPGSLGLHLDGSVANRAVVLGFMPLADGSRGVLESSGKLTCGAEIVEINGQDVSQEPLAGIRERLGRTSGEPRRLSFRLPAPIKLVLPLPISSSSSTNPTQSSLKATSRPMSPVSMQRMSIIAASQPTYSEDTELRRHLEMKLVMNYDRKELKFKECWFAVNAEWMNRWALFVGKGGPEPGSLTNQELLEPEFTLGDDPNRAIVRPGLALTKDYRFVTPMVWCLLVALYGDSDTFPIARFTLDIYSGEHESPDEVLRDAKPQAAGLVTSLREKCKVLNK